MSEEGSPQPQLQARPKYTNNLYRVAQAENLAISWTCKRRNDTSSGDKIWFATLNVNEQPTFTGKGTKKAYAKDDASRQYLVANGHQIPDPLEEE